MAPYGRVTRFERPVSQANYVLHEGMIGVLGEEGLHEITYSSIEEDRSFTTPAAVNEGWLGITDKYWAAVMSPSGEYQPRFSFFDDGRQRFQADFLGGEMKVAAGQSLEVTQKLFAGAKEVDVIDNYETSLGIKNFELLIDWGWFYFITKPMFWLLDLPLPVLRQFRRRHPHRHGPDQGGALPARQHVLSLDGEHEEDAAGDAVDPRALP